MWDVAVLGVCARTRRLCECTEPEVKWHVHFLYHPFSLHFSFRHPVYKPTQTAQYVLSLCIICGNSKEEAER